MSKREMSFVKKRLRLISLSAFFLLDGFLRFNEVHSALPGPDAQFHGGAWLNQVKLAIIPKRLNPVCLRIEFKVVIQITYSAKHEVTPSLLCLNCTRYSFHNEVSI